MAKKISYLDNIKKELADRSRAKDRQIKTSDEAKYGVQGIKQPGAQKRASQARKTLTRATGQLAGAVLMGARYDEKGRRISGKPTAKLKQVPAKTAVKNAKPAAKKK